MKELLIGRKDMLLRRKRKKSEIEYAFMNSVYFFEELTCSLPWARVKYSIL